MLNSIQCWDRQPPSLISLMTQLLQTKPQQRHITVHRSDAYYISGMVAVPMFGLRKMLYECFEHW